MSNVGQAVLVIGGTALGALIPGVGPQLGFMLDEGATAAILGAKEAACSGPGDAEGPVPPRGRPGPLKPT